MEDAVRYAKKYYFWPVSLIMLVLALYFWSAATTALDKKFESNESSYTQSKSSVDGIATNPPNQDYINVIQKKTKKLKTDVVKAWTTLYEKQVANDKWPDIPGVDFNDSPIPNAGCEQYKYRIVEEFKKMTESLHLVAERDKMGVAIDDEIGRVAGTADTPKTTDTDENATQSNEDAEQTAPPAPKKELVIWPEAEIASLITTHFSWTRTPNTKQIHIAQEDFWLLKNLLDAIKTLNEGVDIRDAANLRQINSILITQDAAAKFLDRREKGFFDESTFVKKGEEDSTESGTMEDTAGAVTTDANAVADSSSEDGKGMEPGDRKLYNGRYVDSQGSPLTAEQYFAIQDTSETRLVPVFLSLVIKQESLSELLALLTNAEKPVSIKLVLINPGQGWTPSFDFSRFEDESVDSSSGEAISSDNGGHGVGRPSVRSRRSHSDHSSKAGGSNNKDALEVDEIQVDIYGIITLYNPVTEKRFPQSENATENNDEQSQDADSTESEDNSNEDNPDEDNLDTEEKEAEDNADVKDTEEKSEDENTDNSEENTADDNNTNAKAEPAEEAPAEEAPAEEAPAEEAPADAS